MKSAGAREVARHLCIDQSASVGQRRSRAWGRERHATHLKSCQQLPLRYINGAISVPDLNQNPIETAKTSSSHKGKIAQRQLEMHACVAPNTGHQRM